MSGYREDGSEDRSVLVVAFNRRIFGLAPADGSLVWEHALEGLGEIEVLMAEGRVFAITYSHLHAFHYPSGTPIGVVALPGRYKGRPSAVLERGRLYVGASGEVACFDLDGRALWVQSFSGKGLARVTLGFPGNVRQSDEAGS
ncbi:MAG: PQQ-like beta-propeller repeat protein [Myxococcota bacterium]|nr:PQQ-like beta-propeller repeat protein [Myxococcota bacterium]